ncbi:hypothetical protein [Rhodopseudomonas sp.]|uniref:hypothetical protein n=1 Tax=Rhodopseudomonas sp. TaxID=1078 RepID=UPI0039E22B18
MDIDTVVRAFESMGRYLRKREVVGEIAVYGGTAILLQFPWRKATEDVDATYPELETEGVIKDAAAYAAIECGLPDDWLNNAVGGFTPKDERDEFFLLHGDYPRGEKPGLRVMVAKPEYLCAMKLKALARESYQDKDFNDLVELAVGAGVTSESELSDLFSNFFPGETLDPVAAARIPEALKAIVGRRMP